MAKSNFDVLLTPIQLDNAHAILHQAERSDVKYIVNVGTSIIESKNCISLAKAYKSMFSTIGIHPNDLTQDYKNDLKLINELALQKKPNKIVAIGEIGLDTHYPNYNLKRQKDAFKAQIEIALLHNLAIVVHTRKAPEETLKILHEYRNEAIRGIVHCFSEDLSFATEVITWGWTIGLGGTVTYPKNVELRTVATHIDLNNFVLETDAPFLAPQKYRGEKNHPAYIRDIAEFISDLRGCSLDELADATTANSQRIFLLDHYIS